MPDSPQPARLSIGASAHSSTGGSSNSTGALSIDGAANWPSTDCKLKALSTLELAPPSTVNSAQQVAANLWSVPPGSWLNWRSTPGVHMIRTDCGRALGDPWMGAGHPRAVCAALNCPGHLCGRAELCLQHTLMGVTQNGTMPPFKETGLHGQSACRCGWHEEGHLLLYSKGYGAHSTKDAPNLHRMMSLLYDFCWTC